MGDEIKDETEQEIGGKKSDTPADDKGAKTDETPASKEKALPYDQDPKWKAARAAEKKLNGLLEATKFDSVEDLQTALDDGLSLREIFGSAKDAQAAKAAKEKLEKYEAYWAEQEEKKRRESEDPDETIARLERQLKEKDRKEQAKQEAIAKKKAERDKMIAAYQQFEQHVDSLLNGYEEIPTEYKDIYRLFMGVNHPANKMNITDKNAVAKMVGRAVKQLQAFEQSVIKRQLKNKEKIADVSSSKTETAADPPKKIFLKDARKILQEQFLGKA